MTAIPEDQIILVSVDLFQKLTAYLIERPYREAFQFIDALKSSPLLGSPQAAMLKKLFSEDDHDKADLIVDLKGRIQDVHILNSIREKSDRGPSGSDQSGEAVSG